VLDDVSLMTKVAAKKTAGVLGDDLALNAQQVSGVRADRELPVVWAVAKGSFRNKLILVPAALAISAVAPWAIVPLLMIGGLFLCFEGFEKIAHRFLHGKGDDAAARAERLAKVSDPAVDLVQFEQDKIKGAIRTDFILSAEIIVIALGTVAGASFGLQVAVVSAIAMLMTIGVYGLVAGIVKLDDVGLFLSRRQGESARFAFQRWFGFRLLDFAPFLMKALAIIGTAAMFMVGGGIVVHGLHPLQETIDAIGASLAAVGAVGSFLEAVTPILLNALVGVLVGGVTFVVLKGIETARRAISD
jgi:predicted DNA repair protein MutK